MKKVISILFACFIASGSYAATVAPEPIEDCWQGYIHYYVFKVADGWIVTNNMGAMLYARNNEKQVLGFCSAA